MIFQKVLKGIANLDDDEAKYMVYESGILSNWWRKKGQITNSEILKELTEANLILHLNNYNKPLPPIHQYAALGSTYGEVSPFISTVAGAVQRRGRKNIEYPSFITALKFATKNFTTSGYIFYCYVMTLSKQSIPLEAFSEEVRELHIYRDFMPYHHQGEVTAKICIPSITIEKAEYYDGILAQQQLKAGQIPTPFSVILNSNYQAPEQYSNIRNYF